MDALRSMVEESEDKTHDDTLGSVKAETLVQKLPNTSQNYKVRHFSNTQ